MKTKSLLLCTLIAGILTIIFGGKAFATAGNTAEISGGKTWNICVDAGANYAGSDFVVNVAKTDFASQIVLGNGDCKSVEMAAGTYTVSLSSTMGAGTVSYEIANDTLTFIVANNLRKYLNTFGSIAYTVEGSGEESPFELLFSMPGECQFNGNANVSGDTCKDGDGNPLTNKKYIDTNVALFSEENAGRDFEIYFTLTDYASTQEKQGTLFNAKYENSSMYYPGFTIRTVNTDGGAMEITGRLGKDNTNADKANNSIVTADIKNKEVKIVRVGGMVSYSIDGGEMIPFQNYKNFSRYFEQTAVFGASMQTNGNPQRYYDGTIKDIRVYLKKDTTAKIVFDANGGNGAMAAIEDIEVGTDVVLPANTFTLQNATFDGWNTKIDGTGTAYADGATVTVSAAETIHLYAQWDGRAILDFGADVNSKLKKLAGTNTAYSNDDEKIKAIKTADALPEGFDTSNSKNIISASRDISPVPIYAWFDNSDLDNDGKGDGIIYLYTKADTIEGGNSMTQMFDQMLSLTDISALADWDVSNVTDMSFLFYSNSSLSDISALADWDVSNVTDMFSTFRDMESLSDISILANWSVSNVTDMGIMFAGDALISNISALADWDVSNVTRMEFMFEYITSLSDISALASWNTSNVTNMMYMFSETAITNVDALETKQHEGKDYISWDVSKVKDISGMFERDSYLTDISALASWNTSNVTDMSRMFDDDVALTDISALETKQYGGKDYISWETSNVTSMTGMFAHTTSLSDISVLASWDISNVTSIGGMFRSATSLSDISVLASWDISNVNYLADIFNGASSLSDISALANWNTSNVTSMSGMFKDVTSLSDISVLSSWNTSSVTNMSSMFYDANSLSDISALANWNTSNVTNMGSMFSKTAITNVDALETRQHEGKDYISWDVSNMNDMSYMFSGATSLTDISALASWNTSNVTNMSGMFYNTKIANVNALETKQHEGKGYVSWDTSGVTNMWHMFSRATSLTDISALASWNTSNVTNMMSMFSETAITNVDALETRQHEGKDYISWDVSNVQYVSDIFYGDTSLVDVSALESWDTSRVTQMHSAFSGVPARPLPSWYHE